MIGTFERIVHFTLRDVNRAIRDFDMIRPGDRIAIAVSGGKDSLSLVRLLQAHAALTTVPYEIAAVHVCGDATGVTAAHGPLVSWLAAQDMPYMIVEPELSADDLPPLNCQRCTWLRRKSLFLAADALGCNVIAYAHHADDAAQTTLLNLLYGGQPVTLAPHARYFDGRFRLIRPLIYLPERDLARLARAAGFPPPPPVCPRAADTRRQRVGAMLSSVPARERNQYRANLLRAGLRNLVEREESSSSE